MDHEGSVRDEHPDTRPGDADAPARFLALAEAWQVLGDPARRAGCDRSRALGERAASPLPGAASRVPVRHLRSRRGGPPPAGLAGRPLRAGTVRLERPQPVSPAVGRGGEEITLAVAAGLVVCYLDRPW
jgi:curved DNA-binding protein CbpA